MIINVLFYSFKVFLVLLISMTLIRVAIARLKMDKIAYTYRISLSFISLIGLILVTWDSVSRT